MSTLNITPQDLLDAAHELLAETRWTRAAALLTRQALEHALADFWKTRAPGMQDCSRRAQLDCLPEYLDDHHLATAVSLAWIELTRNVHHQAYELPPAAEDVRGPMVIVGRLIESDALQEIT